MKQTVRKVKVIGITKEGYLFLHNKMYEKRFGRPMPESTRKRLERNVICDLGNGWRGYYNRDLDWTCEEVRAILTFHDFPVKEVDDMECISIGL